jgi:deazaflavin-dependent oxidoreductase (nitroreductase family)
MTIEERAIDGTGSAAAVHARQYLESDGSAVDHPAVGRLILLYTTGRSSGHIRRTPLRFFEVDDDLVVAASYRGSPSHPDWYLNLLEDPLVWIRLNSDLFPARAAEVEEPERSRLWDGTILAEAPQFADYQARTKRVIPLVRLTRKR